MRRGKAGGRRRGRGAPPPGGRARRSPAALQLPALRRNRRLAAHRSSHSLFHWRFDGYHRLGTHLFQSGLGNLGAYLAAHVLLCLVPAFYIAGGMTALIPKEAVTRVLGRNAPKFVSYPAAALAGSVLAVCSCTIVPLFAGIYKKGAGIGPAITFLFFAPAANILALVYTGGVIGPDLAFARLFLSLAFGIGIGEADREKVFEEFFQVGNAARDRSKGLGLGLAIVRRLADLLGEKLTLRSVPGRGSVFALRCSRAMPQPAAE